MIGFFENIFQRLGQVFDPETLITKLSPVLINITVGLTVFAVYYLLWKLVRIALKPGLRRAQIDETVSSFLDTLVKYGLLAVGAINGLDAMGIRTSALLASLGIVGLTVGFAAKDALSNLISGILIFLDRPFVIGDLVELEGFYGRVERITLRSTRIVTSDGKMLAVPNTEVINKTVSSYTNYPHLRIDISVTVGTSEDLESVRRTLLGLVEQDADYLKSPAPRMVVTQLNDYNVALEVQAWIADERRHVEKRYELRERIFNTLKREKVEMPLQTVQLAPITVDIRDRIRKEPT